MTKGPVFCAICLKVRKRDEKWFLLVENRWTDRLKILGWHDELVSRPSTHAACCPAHVQLLVTHWMTAGTLHYPFAHSEAAEKPLPTRLSSLKDEPDLTRVKVLAELAVHRESIGRILVESPTSLAGMLAALEDAIPQQVDRAEIAEPEACGDYALTEA
jgi:hypothetical protein